MLEVAEPVRGAHDGRPGSGDRVGELGAILRRAEANLGLHAGILPLRGGPKEKGGPIVVVGSASEQQTPRVFLVLRLLPYFLWRSLRMATSCAARDASSASTVATSCLSLAWRRASSAAFKASVAFASSRSRPRIAVSASTVTTSGCTSRIPPATKTSSSSPPPAGLILTDPGLMRVICGVWLGLMPNSPPSPGGDRNVGAPG